MCMVDSNCDVPKELALEDGERLCQREEEDGADCVHLEVHYHHGENTDSECSSLFLQPSHVVLVF
jgi:hypothetical protein